MLSTTRRPLGSLLIRLLAAGLLLVLPWAVAGCLDDGHAARVAGGEPAAVGDVPAITEDIDGGTEIPNEVRVRGALYDVSGLPAAGARVTLLPAGYVPDSGVSAAGTFLAITDSAGRYAFAGVPDGYYNVLFDNAADSVAVGAAPVGMAFRDSILVVDSAADVPGDTLRPAGTVTAILNLRPEDGQRTAVVQVPGTTVYRRGRAADPFVLALPQGSFNVRVTLNKPEVAPVTETVSVTAGGSDTLTVSFPTYLFPVLW